MDDAIQQEMVHLIRVSWIVLIPAGVLLSLVFLQLCKLLFGITDFLTLARYELTPALKDLRLTVEHVEALSARAVSGVKTVEGGVAATGPALRSVGRNIVAGVQSVCKGILQSFRRK